MMNEIFSPYFDWLDKTFGNFAKIVKRQNVPVEDVVNDYLSQPQNRQQFYGRIPEILDRVESFWEENQVAVLDYVKRLGGFKARYEGDIGPQYRTGLFERAGLYFDTILVPDPLIRISLLPPNMKIQDYYLLKYGIQQVLLREVYLADCSPPIAILIPDTQVSAVRSNENNVTNLALFDSIAITNDLFGTSLDNFDDVKDFYSRFGSLQKAVDAIERPELIYFDSNASPDINAQIGALQDRTGVDWDITDDRFNPDKAQFLLFTIFGRVLQVNTLMQATTASHSSPILDAPASYHWLQWKITANQRALVREWGLDITFELNLTNALLSKELQWLSNISTNSLVQLRKEGSLSDLRAIITKETANFSQVEFSNPLSVINQVDYNLSTALKQHQNDIKQLDYKLRSDLAISGTTFLLSVAAYFQPIIFPTSPEWIQLLPGVVGTTSFTGLIKSVSSYIRERKLLSSSPVGILWKARE